MRERYQINIRYNQSNNKQMPMIPVKYPAAMNQGLDGTPLKLLEVQQQEEEGEDEGIECILEL